MSKCDRVLVVERIIAALGLGPIRDSQVGTVEKRGISGGQRKRVNVGLEMVMEPSLLILDEPTSGLDSTSSRLVLQALRREASMGVNVGVVLHQPRYVRCRLQRISYERVMSNEARKHELLLGRSFVGVAVMGCSKCSTM
jgi:ABC-type multidrug transport system ATPase subunit